MSVEERVRSATRARADLVRDISPLDLPAANSVRQPRAPRAWWSTWMAPVTAAAVVVALAVTTVALREVRNGPSVPAANSGQSGTGATTAAGVLPRYYAALDNPKGAAFNDKTLTAPVDVVVGDTGTGRPIATVAPPKGQTFAGLTAAADDRTFVLATESLPVSAGIPSAAPVAWYLLRLAPGSARPATLTRLTIPGQPDATQVSGIALSPDGSELAVMYQRAVWQVLNKQGGLVKTGPLTLSVYSVSTGKALRTWTQQTNGFPAGYGWYWGRYSNSSITWLNGGHTLAFVDGGNSGENGPPLAPTFGGVKIRTISLASGGGSLLADSKVIFSSTNHWCDQLQLTADGKTVFCGGYGGNFAKKSSAYDPEITAYSVATGKGRLVYRLKGAYNTDVANIEWLSPNGSAFLVAAEGPDYQLAGHVFKGQSIAGQAIDLITKGTAQTGQAPAVRRPPRGPDRLLTDPPAQPGRPALAAGGGPSVLAGNLPAAVASLLDPLRISGSPYGYPGAAGPGRHPGQSGDGAVPGVRDGPGPAGHADADRPAGGRGRGAGGLPRALPPPFTLRTFSLVTGKALRTWKAAAGRVPLIVPGGSDNEAGLTWTADGRTLAFMFPPSAWPDYERTLNVAGQGTSLLADSRPVLAIPQPVKQDYCLTLLLASDGRTMVCGTETDPRPCSQREPQFNLYSTATGKLTRVLYRYQGTCFSAEADVTWAGAGGTAIVVIAAFRIVNTRATIDCEVGVLAAGKFTPLHVPMPTGYFNVGTLSF